jgi:hypothetical protein
MVTETSLANAGTAAERRDPVWTRFLKPASL